ncbi:histidinol-phosphatase HisJ family protein [Virgibacillus oceani]|uniref:Histidinol-phosphatase n=1 Tax=Virgibacillus oceani TaxID=1479511 RepID=A0A917M6S6_9BACI|nr:histidinol-phosphatase HisJ family protein [Virgibacillus oceani]GGG81549.1 phosphatase [Virgibacillus oceani]
MFDYHVHSNFSADCETAMEKSIDKAIELGLKEICFTDHIDYDYPDPSITFDLDLPTYSNKIEHLKENYSNKITVKKGVEIGVQPDLLPRYEQLMNNDWFDFVICSMHTTEKRDLHSGEFFKDKSIDEAYAAYYNELLYCVKNYRGYNILGHIDLVKRYTKGKADSEHHDIISQIFDEIIPAGKGIELNTSGVRYGLDGGMPSVDILKLYKEMGGEILTLGSDSHNEASIAFNFKESLTLLQQIGFRYITTFEKGEPVFHPIASLK